MLAIGIIGAWHYKSVKITSGDVAVIDKKKSMRKSHVTGGRLTTITLLLVIVLGILTMLYILTI